MSTETGAPSASNATPLIPDRKGPAWEAYKAHVGSCHDGCEDRGLGLEFCPEGQRLFDAWWSK